MKRRVWGNRVISHFAVPGQNLFLTLNPHTKQAQRIVAVASRWHEDSNQQNIASSQPLSFSRMPPIVWGEQRKSVPLTVDFGNQRWVSAKKKLMRTWAPVSGLSCQTRHQAVLFFPDCSNCESLSPWVLSPGQKCSLGAPAAQKSSLQTDHRQWSIKKLLDGGVSEFK